MVKNFMVKLSFVLVLLGVEAKINIANAQIELPPITVVAPSGNSNGWVTVCTGQQCADMFGSMADSWLGNDNETEMGPEEEVVRRLISKTVPDNPDVTEPTANCGTSVPTRMSHAQSDIAHARLHAMPRQRYSRGQILRVTFGNGDSELYAYNGAYYPPVAIPGSCGSRPQP